jgi:hypothetical protein
LRESASGHQPEITLMNKPLIAGAILAAALGAFAPCAEAGVALPQLAALAGTAPTIEATKIGCDEDCADALEARGYDVEPIDHEDEDHDMLRGRGFERDMRERPTPRRATAEPPAKPAKSERAVAEATKDTGTVARKAEVQPEPVKAEARSDAKTCRQYSAAVGMTLSVPCE